MEGILYIIAAALIIGWGIGSIGYNQGGVIHLFLVVAVVIIVIRLLQGKKII